MLEDDSDDEVVARHQHFHLAEVVVPRLPQGCHTGPEPVTFSCRSDEGVIVYLAALECQIWIVCLRQTDFENTDCADDTDFTDLSLTIRYRMRLPQGCHTGPDPVERPLGRTFPSVTMFQQKIFV